MTTFWSNWGNKAGLRVWDGDQWGFFCMSCPLSIYAVAYLTGSTKVKLLFVKHDYYGQNTHLYAFVFNMRVYTCIYELYNYVGCIFIGYFI